MTNEELNRKVHEVRGECLHEFISVFDSYAQDRWIPTSECSKCKKKKCSPNKDYPGNIAHAWELVESLSVDKQAQVLINKLGREILVGNLNIKDSPAAICLAYVEVMG